MRKAKAAYRSKAKRQHLSSTSNQQVDVQPLPQKQGPCMSKSCFGSRVPSPVTPPLLSLSF